jgi:lysozyme family protein
MADFATALAYLAPDEGGYSSDAGGTMYGITKAVAIANGYNGPIQNLPKATADAIYQQSYWESLGLSDLVNQSPATAIFDLNVNMGEGGMAEVAQAALAQLGWAGTQDGQWGPETMAGVQAQDPDAFIVAFSQAAKDKYQAIAADNPAKQPDLAGWLNRADRFLTLQSGLSGTVATVRIGVGNAIQSVGTEITNHPETAVALGIIAVAAIMALSEVIG